MSKILYTDNFEYPDNATAQGAYVSSDIDYKNLLAEEWNNLDGWAENVVNGGITEIDPAGQLHLDCRSATGDCAASRSKDIGTIGTGDYWFKIRFKADKWDGHLAANNYGFNFVIHGGTNQLQFRVGNGFQNPAGDGISLSDGVSYHIIYSHTWDNNWHIIDAFVHNNQTDVDVWVDGNKEVTDGDCSRVTVTDGVVDVYSFGSPDGDGEYHVDYFYIGDVVTLQSYSEDTIKQQGSYSLKGVATDGALNETLTKTLIDYLDYSIQDKIVFQVRSNRTGENLQLQIHDTGGTTSSHTINIIEADEWQTETWDLTGIDATDRDTIDKLIIKVIEASAPNTFYFDNLFSEVDTECVSVWIGG